MTWLTNNYNTNIAQYLTKGNQTMKSGQLIEYNQINIFSKNHAGNETGRLL